jgi:hypothetical protein
MKKFLFVAAAFVTALFIYAFVPKHHTSLKTISEYKIKYAVSCTPDRKMLSSLLDEMDIPPMPGAGKYQWKISTTNDSAQFYFNQGINMYYGFHIIESLASFKKASRFDPENAMAWWAQALAYGPNINDVGYSASPEALYANEKAFAFSSKSSPLEKNLIKAMLVRYSADSTQSREKLNQDYVDAMKKLADQYPANADVITLYADALMLQHPWDMWNNNGTPKAWTPRIRSALEKAIALNSNHPGANHYYIHVMEASPYADKALASANRLGSLTPGLAHMVHMPSHIYLRTGQFAKGVDINTNAINNFNQYSTLFSPSAEGAFIYLWHNLHMKADCALMAGKYSDAIQAAKELQNAIDTSLLSLPAPMGIAVQYVYMTPVLMNVHFGKWDDLLTSPEPSSNHVFQTIIYHFGKGMAYAAKKQLAEAKASSMALDALLGDQVLTISLGPFSPPTQPANVASELLKGFIAVKENDIAKAIVHFSTASGIEENMVYKEPRDWLLNSKQYEGTAYLMAKQWVNAEKTFRTDLKRNAQNVWSLTGLAQALKGQKKFTEAKLIEGKLKNSVAKGDLQMSRLNFD